MFQGLEHKFQDLVHMFQGLEHKFQGFEYKKVPEEKTFSPLRNNFLFPMKQLFLPQKIIFEV